MRPGAVHIPPRFPPSAGSWWLQVPREQWRAAYEQQAPRLASVTVKATGVDVPRTHQKLPRHRRVL